MPSYVYRCECGRDVERFERMFYSTAVVCPDCGGDMWRVPQRTAVVWGGLRPSQGELHPEVRSMIDDAPRNRDTYAVWKEAHLRQTEHEHAHD